MIVVKTQQELDAALTDDAALIVIYAPRGVWLSLSHSGNATVRAWGNATVRAWGNATIEASGNATVRAWDNATVRAWGNATIEASGNATVRAWDNATIEASGNATVRAWDNATIEAWDNATIEASGNATVRAWDNATIEAASHVAVHLHSAAARVDGGVVIDVTAVNDRVESWLAYRGIDVADGTAIVYKYVRSDYRSHYGVTYTIGETVEAADWEPSRTCGHGLHFGATPTEARQYGAVRHDPGDERWLACEIDVAEAVMVGSSKIKARICRVLHEVTLDGERVEGAS